ncbi:MAG: glycerate kinase [Solirubrobacteraceae bacterium]
MPDRDAAHTLPRVHARRTGFRAEMLIPDTLLLAVCAFGEELPAERVAHAIAKGVRAGGMAEPDQCPIADSPPADFDVRMRRARAVVVGACRLDRQTLMGSPVFEIATRARQAGVPAYAVTAVNELDAFDARILDLQVILEASSTRTLSAAGRRLADLA